MAHAINAYYKYEVLERAVQFNPVDSVVKPNKARFEKTTIETLNDEEIRKFISAANARNDKGEPVYLHGQAFILMLNTGIRLGEALALTWDDINFEEKELHITKNAIFEKNRNEDGNADGTSKYSMQNTPKSRSSIRVILLNRAAMNALESLFKRRNGDYVIASKTGRHVYPAPFKVSLERICARAGIKRITPHVLRHTFATKMIENGVNVKIVSKVMGHSSVAITYDTYVHVISKVERQAMEAIDFIE